MKPTLYILVGLPASGKSEKAQEISKKTGAVIHSSDALREEWFGDASTPEANNKDNNRRLFTELHNRIARDLRAGKDVVYDACNINRKKRMSFIRDMKKRKNSTGDGCLDFNVVVEFTFATVEKCVKNNESRNRKVPPEVIFRMYKNFQTPYFFENVDEIHVSCMDSIKPIDVINSMENFNQHNSNHTLDLLSHCASVAIKMKTPKMNLYLAGLYHDIGKLTTQVFHDSKGNPTQEAHYYGHENASAYDIFGFNNDYKVDDLLYMSLIINYHMQPHTTWKQSAKALKRDRKLLGEKLYKDIMILNTADCLAR